MVQGFHFHSRFSGSAVLGRFSSRPRGEDDVIEDGPHEDEKVDKAAHEETASEWVPPPAHKPLSSCPFQALSEGAFSNETPLNRFLRINPEVAYLCRSTADGHDFQPDPDVFFQQTEATRFMRGISFDFMQRFTSFHVLSVFGILANLVVLGIETDHSAWKKRYPGIRPFIVTMFAAELLIRIFGSWTRPWKSRMLVYEVLTIPPGVCHCWVVLFAYWTKPVPSVHNLVAAIFAASRLPRLGVYSKLIVRFSDLPWISAPAIMMRESLRRFIKHAPGVFMAILCVTFLGSYAMRQSSQRLIESLEVLEQDPDDPETLLYVINTYFKDLGTSMRTFMEIFAGNFMWGRRILTPLYDYHPFAASLFGGYVFLGYLGMANFVVGNALVEINTSYMASMQKPMRLYDVQRVVQELELLEKACHGVKGWVDPAKLLQEATKAGCLLAKRLNITTHMLRNVILAMHQNDDGFVELSSLIMMAYKYRLSIKASAEEAVDAYTHERIMRKASEALEDLQTQVAEFDDRIEDFFIEREEALSQEVAGFTSGSKLAHLLHMQLEGMEQNFEDMAESFTRAEESLTDTTPTLRMEMNQLTSSINGWHTAVSQTETAVK